MFRHVATAITTALARFGQWLANDWVMDDPHDEWTRGAGYPGSPAALAMQERRKRAFIGARQQGKSVMREGVPLVPRFGDGRLPRGLMGAPSPFPPKPDGYDIKPTIKAGDVVRLPPTPADVIGEDELRAELDRLLGPEQARNALKPRKVEWPPSRDMLEGGGPAVSQERCPCCGGLLDPAVHVSLRGR